METTASSTPAPLDRRTVILGRLGMAGLDLLGFGLPLVGAVITGWWIEGQITASTTGFTRIAWVVLLSIAALGAVDRTLGGFITARYRRLHGRLNGVRTWSCEHCPMEITAARWTAADADTFEDLVADQDAHRCTGRK